MAMYVTIILTPYEYDMVLPALAINAASKPALHTALLSNSIIYTRLFLFYFILFFFNEQTNVINNEQINVIQYNTMKFLKINKNK